jgi:hypothetical protein
MYRHTLPEVFFGALCFQTLVTYILEPEKDTDEGCHQIVK